MKNYLIKHKVLVAVMSITVVCLLLLWNLLIVQRRQGINLDNGIDSVSFSSNDRYLAVASSHGVQVYDVATEELYKTVMTFRGILNPIASTGAYYSNDGEQLVVLSPMDSGSTTSRKVKLEEEFPVFDSASLKITNQKPKAYISTERANWGKGYWAELGIWTDIDDPEWDATHPQYEADTIVVQMGGSPFVIKVPDDPSEFAINTFNSKLAIASNIGDVYIFDLQKRKITSSFSCELQKSDGGGSCTSLIWFPKQHLIWASNVEGRSVFWDSLHHKVKADIQIPLVITCAAINHAGDSIAFGTMDGQVHIIQTKQLLKAINNGSIVHFFLTVSESAH
ncbi:MAG: hypothetical protein ABI210_05860 [Abditibacteriaceae bacterium]